MTKTKIYELWKTIETEDVVLKKGLKKMSVKKIEEKFSKKLVVKNGSISAPQGAGSGLFNSITLSKFIVAYIEKSKPFKILVAHDGSDRSKFFERETIALLAGMNVKIYQINNGRELTIAQASFIVKEMKFDGAIYLGDLNNNNELGARILNNNGAPIIGDKKLTEHMKLVKEEKVKRAQSKISKVDKKVLKKWELSIDKSVMRKDDSKIIKVAFDITTPSTNGPAQRVIAKQDIPFEDKWKIKSLIKRKTDIIIETNSIGSKIVVTEGKRVFANEEIAAFYLEYLFLQLHSKNVKLDKYSVSLHKSHKLLAYIAKKFDVTIHYIDSKLSSLEPSKYSIKGKKNIFSITKNGEFTIGDSSTGDSIKNIALIVEAVNYYRTQNRSIAEKVDRLKEINKK